MTVNTTNVSEKNRSVDIFLVTLARNKAFDQLRKLEIGRATHKICKIMK